MNLKEILSINLRYYRKKYNLSQERFAEAIGTSLSHLNKMEQQKVDVKLSTITKYANNLSKFSKENIEPIDFLNSDNSRITYYSRIDEKKQS
jgi:transcriptional regulator with XRE-family HTH domain